MSRKFKNLLIRFLFRLLDTQKECLTEKEQKHMQRWLSDSWRDPGFIAYSKMRGQEIQKILANGEGMKEHPRDNYIRMSGQRFEHSRFMLQVKNSFNKKDKEAKAKDK